jgi:DNA-binding MarR family transcriptional regulator
MIVAREIHRALRKLQIKNRRVRKGAEIPVAVAGAHLLVELHAGKELSVNDLATALMIPQSQVSRILQKLRSRRLIQQRGDPADSRRALSTLTQSGLMVVQRIDEVIGSIFQECADRINKAEADELAFFFEHIAYGLGCEQIRRRKNEDKLRAAHRQMARVFGILGTSVYESGLTRSEWAILEALFSAPEPLTATILERYLGIKPAVISEILNRYELQGYINRVRAKTNHRVNLIHLTTAGRRHFTHLETRAVLRLQTALKGIPAAHQKILLTLLHRFVGEWGARSIFLGSTFVTSSITDPLLVAEARAFVFREIVRLGWESAAPDPLFPRGHEVWGLFDGDPTARTLRAVCVVADESRSWVVNLCAWSGQIEINQAVAFVQHAHYLSNRRGIANPLAIKFEPLRCIFPKTGW